MKPKFLVLLVTLLLAKGLFAQNKVYKNEAGFKSDNDGFLGQGSDNYYTAGNFFYFRHALKITQPDKSALANKILGFELGQRIYTPQSGSIPSSIYVDRPFAGYLYLGSTLNLLYKNESNLKLQAQVGFVGQYSYGMEVQDLIHKTFGFYPPSGWQYQIRNDFEVNLSAEYNKLLVRNSNIDASVHTYANLGTGLTGLGVGPLLRLGKFNQLCNSASTLSTVTQNKTVKTANTGEFFVYNKALVNYVAYNATIQGSLFKHPYSRYEITSTLQPIVLSDQIGVSFVNHHWGIDLSAIFQTRDTKEMAHVDQWGSIAVYYRFN